MVWRSGRIWQGQEARHSKAARGQMPSLAASPLERIDGLTGGVRLAQVRRRRHDQGTTGPDTGITCLTRTERAEHEALHIDHFCHFSADFAGMRKSRTESCKRESQGRAETASRSTTPESNTKQVQGIRIRTRHDRLFKLPHATRSNYSTDDRRATRSTQGGE